MSRTVMLSLNEGLAYTSRHACDPDRLCPLFHVRVPGLTTGRGPLRRLPAGNGNLVQPKGRVTALLQSSLVGTVAAMSLRARMNRVVDITRPALPTPSCGGSHRPRREP